MRCLKKYRRAPTPISRAAIPPITMPAMAPPLNDDEDLDGVELAAADVGCAITGEVVEGATVTVVADTVDSAGAEVCVEATSDAMPPAVRLT